jgi:hypothetical protein
VSGVQMGRRPLWGMVLAWVAVVLAVATVTFVVVDRAGRGVGQASAAGTVAPVPSAGASTTPGMPGTATPTASPSASPTASATGTATGSPTTVTRTASFPTAGGTVVASCEGTTIVLGSITVRDGWRLEDEAEQGEIEVKFRTDAKDVDDVELVLRCVDGIPTAIED